jgi:sugar lactone lactonase YvrE
LNGPKAVAVDKLGNLYVADTGNNRVLQYITPFSSGKTAGIAASMVFGQGLDFTSSQCNFGITAIPDIESMCSPSGLALDSAGNLFVADTNNNRVLVYKVPFNAATDANIVFGQNGSFTSNLPNLASTTPSSKGLFSPAGLAVDTANNLYVADAGNNRVLKFNTPLTNTTANLVFGQLGLFVLNACNEGGTPGSGTLCGPMGVAVDALGDVFIGDTNNNRELMFKPPIATSPIANFVFGQGGSFSSTQCNGGFGTPPSNATLCGPHGLAPDSTNANLFIADTTNNRVLRWPYSATTGPAAVANVVVGQPDFTHNSSNTVDATGLCGPAAAAIDKSATPNHLWVVDTTNNRVLGYTAAATFATYSAATIVIGQPDFYSAICNQGTGVSSKTLCAPNAAAVDATGNLYVADGNNNRILEYTNTFLSGIKANQAAAVVFGQGGILPRVRVSALRLIPALILLLLQARPLPEVCAYRQGSRSTSVSAMAACMSPMRTITGSCASSPRLVPILYRPWSWASPPLPPTTPIATPPAAISSRPPIHYLAPIRSPPTRLATFMLAIRRITGCWNIPHQQSMESAPTKCSASWLISPPKTATWTASIRSWMRIVCAARREWRRMAAQPQASTSPIQTTTEYSGTVFR